MIFAKNLQPIFITLNSYSSLEYSSLIDLLSKYTRRYTELSRDRTADPIEYLDCERMVLDLQEEIENRRREMDRDRNYTRS